MSDLLLALGGTLGPTLIRSLGLTWSIRQSGDTYYSQRNQGATTRVIYSIWHRDILLLGYFARNQGIKVLISQHRDGELIARIVEKLGFTTFRGSTTRGGVKALKSLDSIHDDPTRCDLAFTPDGPKGPAKKLQKGVIFASAKTGFPIIPVGTAVSRSWEVNSWDRFRIPKPFSRCWVQIGPEMPIPSALDDAALEQKRDEVEAAMHQMERVAQDALKTWSNGSAA